jgi:hypothetical protein
VPFTCATISRFRLAAEIPHEHHEAVAQECLEQDSEGDEGQALRRRQQQFRRQMAAAHPMQQQLVLAAQQRIKAHRSARKKATQAEDAATVCL